MIHYGLIIKSVLSNNFYSKNAMLHIISKPKFIHRFYIIWGKFEYSPLTPPPLIIKSSIASLQKKINIIFALTQNLKIKKMLVFFILELFMFFTFFINYRDYIDIFSNLSLTVAKNIYYSIRVYMVTKIEKASKLVFQKKMDIFATKESYYTCFKKNIYFYGSHLTKSVFLSFHLIY